MQDKLSILNSLAGICKGNPISLEEAKQERLVRKNPWLKELFDKESRQ
jgi:hypothetical protein